MIKLRNPLIVGLDVDDGQRALELAQALGARAGAWKIGPRLNLRYGQKLIEELSAYAPVFVDNKFLDIPNTMESAVRAAFEAGATLVTVHAWAGPVALKRLAEVEAELRQKRPFQLLVVSILTSFDAESLPHGMVAQPIAKHVEGLVEMAIGCGLTGFVCSAQELPLFKTSGVDRLADRFWVTPGIRMGDESAADQKRVTTPELAMSLGASAIVVARPIVDAPDPVQAADLYLRHLSTFQSSVKTTAQTSFDSPASGTATPAALASALGAHEGSSSERNGGRT